MKRRLRLAASLATTIGFMFVTGAVAGNDFDYCLLCHGANGNGNYGIRAPKISGMEPWYLARQLDNFASGARGTPPEDTAGHEMRPVGWRVKNENTLDAAVKFIAKLESRRPAPTVAGDATHGKTLYAACAACHGAKGEGNKTLQAPALAERSDWYLVTQLTNYQKGLRGTDARDTYGAQMRAIISTLPDEKAVADVVAYINTL